MEVHRITLLSFNDKEKNPVYPEMHICVCRREAIEICDCGIYTLQCLFSVSQEFNHETKEVSIVKLPTIRPRNKANIKIFQN